MKYNPIEEEKKWWSDGEAKNRNTKKPLPPKHHFAHGCVHSRLYDTLIGQGDLKEYLGEFVRVTRGGGLCDSIRAKLI